MKHVRIIADVCWLIAIIIASVKVSFWGGFIVVLIRLGVTFDMIRFTEKVIIPEIHEK